MPALSIFTSSEQQDDSAIVSAIKTPKKSSPHQEAKIRKRLNRILKREDNKLCLDCSKPNPKWAALLSLPLQSPTHDRYDRPASTLYIGGLCCLECSGAHRRLGTHISFIRSVELDSLTENEVKALEVGGNSVVNSIFEGRLLSGRISHEENNISVSIQKKDLKPDASSGQKQREHFTKNKYERKTYLDAVALSRFQQKSKNIVRSPSNMGLGQQELVLSPTHSSSSSSSSPEASTTSAPLQLQVFTSSPRTLAMIEKYLNPKPKKKFLNKRLRFLKKRKKRGIKSSLQNLVQDGTLGVNPNIHIMQTRSEDLASAGSAYSPSLNTSCSDCNSICSARSTMSEMWRKTNWPSTSSRKKTSFERTRLFRKERGMQRRSLDDNYEPALSPRKKGGFYYSKVHLSPSTKLSKPEVLGEKDLVQEGSAIKLDASLLDIVDEAASYGSPRPSDKKKKKEEIRTLALWSRNIDKAMKKMFKKVTPKSPHNQGIRELFV